MPTIEKQKTFAISEFLSAYTAAFGIAFAAMPAFGFEIEYSGHTSRQMTWQLPTENTPDRQPARTPYSVQSFKVDNSGTYDFVGTNRDTGWKMASFLYRDRFDPDTPFDNLVYGTSGRTPLAAPKTLDRFTYQTQLTAGRDYFLVTSARENNCGGEFACSISGTGNIILTAATVKQSIFKALKNLISKQFFS